MNYNYDYGNYMMDYPYIYGYGNNKMNYMNNQNDVSNIKRNGNNLVDPYIGLIRGNLFADLYEAYGNYQPSDIEANNERESLLGQIQMYKFVITDLNLYLDINPNDKEIVNIFKEYVKLEKELCKEYEKRYGPLTVDGVIGNSFTWIDSPWTWEVSK